MKGFKRLLWGAFALVVGGALLAFFGVLPEVVDGRINRVVPHQPWPVSPAARRLHEDILVGDLHADSLLWRRDLLARNGRGLADVPRLLEGGVGIQVFGSVTKTPADMNYDANRGDSDNITLLAISSLWPVRTWTGLTERALYHAEKLDDFAARSDGRLRVVRDAADLAAVLAARDRGEAMLAGLLGLEGAHALEGDIAALERLFDAGYRMIGLAHFFDNEVAGSMHGVEKYGLTALGRDVVRRAGELGMIVDIAHAAPAAVDDVLALSTRPVVSSHGGVRAICDVNRNLDDATVRRIAAGGGLIGLGAWEGAACGTTPAHLARAMRHVRDLVGIEHVALGSDFDGAVQVAFDASEYAALTQALIDEGFSDDEIRAALGGNVARFLLAQLPPG